MLAVAASAEDPGEEEQNLGWGEDLEDGTAAAAAVDDAPLALEELESQQVAPKGGQIVAAVDHRSVAAIHGGYSYRFVACRHPFATTEAEGTSRQFEQDISGHGCLAAEEVEEETTFFIGLQSVGT